MDIIAGISKIIDEGALDKLNLNMAEDISYLAKGQDLDEVLSYFGLKIEDIKGEDLKFVNLIISRTKACAKAEATNALFESMKSKNAESAALSYLDRFSPGWKTSDNNLNGKVFSFNMLKS